MPRSTGAKQPNRAPKKEKPKLAVENTVCYLQVLGLGTDCGDAAPSVLLFFDRQRYLFNAGEGFQRFCVEHKVRMNRISSCLLTRLTGDASGGLPGMCLTMADAGASERPSLDIIGPVGLTALLEAARTYVSPSAVAVTPIQFGGGSGGDGSAQTIPEESSKEPATVGLPPVVKNDLLTITPVILHPEATPAPQSDPEAQARKKPRLDVGNGSAPLRPGLSQSGPSPFQPPEKPAAASYICELARVPGRFLPDKAVELGVPCGRLFAALKGGQSVTLEDGRVIEPHLVNEPHHPGPVAVIADCPDEDYLPSLVGNDLWRKKLWATDKAVDVVCHMAPPEVVARAQYQCWCTHFGNTTRHIFIHCKAAGASPVMASSAMLQAKLNAVHPSIFPMHLHGATSSVTSPEPGCSPGGAASTAVEDPFTNGFGERQIPGQNLLKFHLRPPQRKGTLDAGEVPASLDFEAARLEQCSRQDLREAVQSALTPSTASAADEGTAAMMERLGRENLQLVMLGTGAAMPSKYRNVTGNFLDFFARGSMLVDCGEGSYGQLRRTLGEAADDALKRLKCIWISHIHADHHVGLTRVLSKRRRLLGSVCPDLLVIGPRALHRALLAHSRLEPLAYHFLECRLTAANQSGPSLDSDKAALSKALAALSLKRLESFGVEHCADAHGLLLESCDGWKLVFSGDTRPCSAVETAARDATLLVHEATFDDALREEAVQKRHSMTCEAVGVGHRAGAYRTMLTHFSQRYPKVPVIDDSFRSSTCIAFDLMTVNLQDLPILPALVLPLSMVFPEENAAQTEPPDGEEV